jgi:Ankyrin repeat
MLMLRIYVQSASPLHWACQRGHMDSVNVLLSHGANTAAVNTRKQAPLDVIGELCYVRHDTVKAIKTKVCLRMPPHVQTFRAT